MNSGTSITTALGAMATGVSVGIDARAGLLV